MLYEKVPYTCDIRTGQNTKYTTHHLRKSVKKKYDKQFTTVTIHKNVQNDYNRKCTHNVNTHWNFLYTLKIRNCLNLKEKPNFLAQLSCHLLRSDV